MSVPKEELHRLVDVLPDREIPTAKRFLEFLMDFEENEIMERMTVEDMASIQRGLDDLKNGNVMSWDDLRKEFKE